MKALLTILGVAAAGAGAYYLFQRRAGAEVLPDPDAQPNGSVAFDEHGVAEGLPGADILLPGGGGGGGGGSSATATAYGQYDGGALFDRDRLTAPPSTSLTSKREGYVTEQGARTKVGSGKEAPPLRLTSTPVDAGTLQVVSKKPAQRKDTGEKGVVATVVDTKTGKTTKVWEPALKSASLLSKATTPTVTLQRTREEYGAKMRGCMRTSR